MQQTVTEQQAKEYLRKLNSMSNRMKNEFELRYSDIRDETKEKMILGEFYELHWDDFTPEFQFRFLSFYGENGNYDVIPLIVCLDQFMIDDITPVFGWAKVD